MKLTDAVSYLRSTTDQTHKFWGYYQAVTVAAIVFVWSSSKPPTGMIAVLVVAYLAFSTLNCRLIFSSQESALKIWQCIQEYKPNISETELKHFIPLLDLGKPDNPYGVLCMQASISILASAAMLARIKFGG
ncbi:MAG: hypothetical protein Q7J43_17300 [Pseudomonas sp.]|uniref:hypothetical protein n=1 Tax=Pseudomonas sp. TaxID=306 RepID=UPI00271DC1DF|nr:hypothetical protein [Pseudomonas sp.]MDO9619426.1 hypothetical protein [Pseudomonas sp.]MDP2447375.1 hypothetical protein [Pseudomonas sp.]MDZ4298844.1 hypothetical protein [Moraxellaceae bacterium]